MPFAFGPWKRTTTTVSPVNSPALKASFTASWSWNTRAGASMTWRSGATAETFITPVPRLPASRRDAAGRLEGIGRPAAGSCR